MYEDLSASIDVIVANAQALLNEADGPLDDKQKNFVRIILANTEKFIHLATEFLSVPLAEISPDMRHDLGNPLTPIHGYSELLRMRMMETLNEYQQQSVMEIHHHTNELRRIVDSLVLEARAASAAQ